MGLVTWLMAKLSAIQKNAEESTIQALRNEIARLQRENKSLKEKVIMIPLKKNEEIPIKFFDADIEVEIIKNIRETKEELCIAVAWFTSYRLMEELNSLKRRGVKVKVIISDAKENVRQKNINKLSNACNIVKIAVIPRKANEESHNLMHNKYCVLDNRKVIDGSCNWSYNAKDNLEHIIVIESRTVAKMYKDSFNSIYNNPSYYENFNGYEEIG